MGIFMKVCKKCSDEKCETEFYNSDSTCKECRKEMVRANRAEKAEYYREYDRNRFKTDQRVRDRHARYAATDAGKAATARAKKKYIELNPIKRLSHIIVGNAMRDGRLIKMPCEVCGTTSKIHAHHDDYSAPMSVRWMCAKHHAEWHLENGEGANAL